MRLVYAVVMLIFSVIAFYYSTRIFYNQGYKKTLTRLFTLFSIASGVWSLGYGLMFWTSNLEIYPLYRIIGMAGITLFMIFGQLLIGEMSRVQKVINKVLIAETLMAIGVMVLVAYPGHYTVKMTDAGIVSEFTETYISIIYTAFTVIIAGVFVGLTINLTSKKYLARERAIGKASVRLEVLIGAGMIVDTILPAVGINFNIPASTILQFIGLVLMYRATFSYNQSVINMSNMTSYIYQSLNVPILVFDTEHVLKIANMEAKRFFKLDDDYESTDIVRDFWSKCFGVDPSGLDIIGNSDKTLDVQELVGGRNCKLSEDPIFDKYGDYIGYIVLVNDMTGEIRHMNELAAAKEEAEVANKAKSLFLANMSHEMRTPMNAISGFAEVALRDESVTGQAREYFTDIHSSTQTLINSVSKILSISQIETGTVKLNDVQYCPAVMFKEIDAVIRQLALDKNLDFRIDVSEDFPERMVGDKDKLQEILINLLINAVAYTDYGSVRLKAQVLSCETDTAHLQFKVEDTGQGIAPEKYSSIFEYFERGDIELNTRQQGLGIGLSISKGYVDIMKGRINVDSIYGRGSVFTVELDQKVETAPSEEAIEAASTDNKNGIVLKDITILCVDDNRMNLKLCYNVFKRYGINAQLAISGQVSIDMATKKNYDLIFMDQMMPEMDGIEAMKKIRELGGGYEKGGKNKIIALTANTMPGVREMMLEEGFDEFLGKPIDFKQLEMVLEKFLDSSKLTHEKVR